MFICRRWRRRWRKGERGGGGDQAGMVWEIVFEEGDRAVGGIDTGQGAEEDRAGVASGRDRDGTVSGGQSEVAKAD